MGSSSGVARGQLRPHFGGRSPPFLVAALCVGLCILGISYYNLSSQYTTLELQFSAALQRKDSIERGEELVQNQLHLKEDEFGKARVTLEKKEREVVEMQQQLAVKEDQISKLDSTIQSRQDEEKQRNAELEQLKKGGEVAEAQKLAFEHSLSELKEKMAQLERENEQLKNELQSLKDTDKTANSKLQLDQSEVLVTNKSNNKDIPSSKTDNINLDTTLKDVEAKSDKIVERPSEAKDIKDAAANLAANTDQLQPPKSNEGREKLTDSLAKEGDAGPVDIDNEIVGGDPAKFMAAMKHDVEDNGLDGDVKK